MTDPISAPVFAGRYRFQPVGEDWDTGRSGFTHLIYDLQEKHLGVIKRAEISSKQAVKGLENEVAALRALKGLGVPEVYDTGQASYGSQKYFYVVIEYIDGMRVERNLASLSVTERVDILTQVFGLLAVAHRKGIVNGDVDLKHLFWLRDKRQLIVIDWGNAKVGVGPNKSTEFSYDMARAAEIIFSLITLQGQPLARGSIALPDASALIPGLTPVPVEFRNLCEWAPRAPHGGQAPYTGAELFEVSKRWLTAIKSLKPHKASDQRWKLLKLIGMIMFILILAAFFVNRIFFNHVTTSTPALPSMEILSPEPPVFDKTPSLTIPASVIPSVTENPMETPASTSTMIFSSPTLPSPTLIFNRELTFTTALKNCWKNETNLPRNLKKNEGFYRTSNEDWGFYIGGQLEDYLIQDDLESRSIENYIQADFSTCIGGQPIRAMALNIFVTRIEPERENPAYAKPGAYDPAREFGFYLEDQSGNKREYTFWVDKDDKLHLRVRENNVITDDDVVPIISLVNFRHGGIFPRIYNQFPIQTFLEIDNQGFDIVYLRESPFEAVQAIEIQPNQMTRIDYAVRETLGNLQKIGLLGRGGETRVLIWPLIFYER
jgi:serine/threonine protein kinase